MIIKNVQLETVAGITSVLPKNALPEFAFWGKSNVGKSSLLNALMGRRSYARISSEPGKTATVNYYNVNGSLYLVDLPGYGYAKVSEKTREQWKKMTERYLKGSAALKRVFLLVDMRHEPGANDLSTLNWLTNAGIPFTVVLTKADKLSKNEQANMQSLIRKALPKETEIIPVSAEKKEGIEAVWKMIGQLMGNDSGEQ